MKTKTCIMHDTFLYKWGGERLILMMAKTLDADIASGFFSAGSYNLRDEGFKGKMIPLSSEVFKKGFRHLKLKYAFLFKTKFLRDYDTVIFSWDSISAVRNMLPSQKKIYYCHTPPRYLYDLHDLYVAKIPWYLRWVFELFCKIFKYLYERDIKKMDLILTNSINTQKRIKACLGLDAQILYPPVDESIFQFRGQGDYYLSFARLADAKRVDRVVWAFLQMPEKKLVVTYGKNDPQRDKIFAMIQDAQNITCVTLPNNEDFYNYIGNCIATIYIPIDEDFGMSPVESMCAGKPVLGVNDGGLKETIVHEKTWVLIDPSATREDLIKAIQYLSPERCLEMKEACEARAWDFSLASFQKELWKIVGREE